MSIRIVIRTALVAVVLASLCTQVVRAQDWAQKMFETTYHDFGGVARGSVVEFPFRLKNIYQENVHIVSVRSSCGCTSPKIEKETLKTYEEGAIIAAFNTRSFTGQKGATITVTIDQPYYAEVQLKVSGYIRTDVVLNPPGVEFGSVEMGAKDEKKIAIQYAGRSDWKITGIQPHSDFLETNLVETGRKDGQVSYELTVRLRPDAPAGYMKEQILLNTNDQRSKEFPVDVQARVVAPLTASPSSLFFGAVESGKKVTRQVVIQAKQPFRITGVRSDDTTLEFGLSDEAKTVHLVPVTFTGGEHAGKITRKIVIETDLAGDATTELTAYAQVIVPAKN
ncbi:MAG TPA: DUF1573 domain-containing protein [Pirellulales bacterium]|nr:DUF1573 domain-containing protein [Pirellulales bacterium]